MSKTFKKIQPRFTFEAPAPVPAPVPVEAVPAVVSAPAVKKTPVTETPQPKVVETPLPEIAKPGYHLPELSKSFLYAGRALFTVNNETTKEHHTYKVTRKQGEWRGKKTNTYFVKIKDVSAQWGFAYLGILRTDGTLMTTSKSRYRVESKEFKVAQWACQVVFNGKPIPDTYHIQHAGRCGKCGKELTDPTSIKFGIGPECRKAMGL